MVNRNERHVHLSHQFLSMYFLGQSIKASREEKNEQIVRFGVYLLSQKKCHDTVLNCSSYFATGSSPYSICSSATASIPTKLHTHSSNAQVYGMYYTESNKALIYLINK